MRTLDSFFSKPASVLQSSQSEPEVDQGLVAMSIKATQKNHVVNCFNENKKLTSSNICLSR